MRSYAIKPISYHRHSFVATKIGCLKKLGERVMAQDLKRQVHRAVGEILDPRPVHSTGPAQNRACGIDPLGVCGVAASFKSMK